MATGAFLGRLSVVLRVGLAATRPFVPVSLSRRSLEMFIVAAGFASERSAATVGVGDAGASLDVRAALRAVRMVRLAHVVGVRADRLRVDADGLREIVEGG